MIIEGLPQNLLLVFSSRADGTMLNRTIDTHAPEIVRNRQKFCQKNGISYESVVYQRIIYGDDQSYNRLVEVGCDSTTKNIPEVVADGLFTREKNVALMLPVADCVATIIYDPKCEFLAMLHLGRHSTLTSLLEQTLRKFIAEGSASEDLQIWMSPSIQASHYVMNFFDQAKLPEWQKFCQKLPDGFHLDLPGFNAEICRKCGVRPENIHLSTINTAVDSNYFSHSMGDKSGRFVALAMMR